MSTFEDAVRTLEASWIRTWEASGSDCWDSAVIEAAADVQSGEATTIILGSQSWQELYYSHQTFYDYINWTCLILFQGEIAKTKQSALQALVFNGICVRVTSGFSKVIDDDESISSATNPCE